MQSWNRKMIPVIILEWRSPLAIARSSSCQRHAHDNIQSYGCLPIPTVFLCRFSPLANRIDPALFVRAIGNFRPRWPGQDNGSYVSQTCVTSTIGGPSWSLTIRMMITSQLPLTYVAPSRSSKRHPFDDAVAGGLHVLSMWHSTELPVDHSPCFTCSGESCRSTAVR
jgi:hypothetical protein